ncbi:MAG: hypothetical protein HYZ75_14455 [Elusimicrobia bacterium]|nr:hypothetical protein [Elusimicrobiota bacterium]
MRTWALLAALAVPSWAGPTRVVVEAPVLAPAPAGAAAAGASIAPTLSGHSVLPSLMPTPVVSVAPRTASPSLPTPALIAPAPAAAPVIEAAFALPATEHAPGVLPGARAGLDAAAQLSGGLGKGPGVQAAAAARAFDGAGKLGPLNAVDAPTPSEGGFGRRASGLSPPGSSRLFPGLKKNGHSVSAPGVGIPEGLLERMAAVAAKRSKSALTEKGEVIELYDAGRWKADPGAREDGGGGFKELLDGAYAELAKALPGEAFELRDAHLRIVRDDVPAGNAIHADLGGYMTLTLALDGPGTVLYLPESGGYKTSEAATLSMAVITNAEREALTGDLSTLHSAPQRVVPRRTMLIVRYKPSKPVHDAFYTSARDAAKRRAERARQALAPKPAVSPLGGFFKRLLGG